MNNSYLSHHGIKGQHWGVRRFQESDGSLTSAGKARYDGDGNSKSSKKELKELRKLAKANKKNRYVDLNGNMTRKGKKSLRKANNHLNNRDYDEYLIGERKKEIKRLNEKSQKNGKNYTKMILRKEKRISDYKDKIQKHEKEIYSLTKNMADKGLTVELKRFREPKLYVTYTQYGPIESFDSGRKFVQKK